MEPGAVLKGVADECGFRDADHLYSVFLRVEGVSPSDYREQRGWKKA
jgi:AraC-like DNA-binding protein